MNGSRRQQAERPQTQSGKWRRYFCHITKFMNLLDGYPQPGQRVSFELATTPRGEAAVDIQIII